jgi:hypothetical protein
MVIASIDQNSNHAILTHSIFIKKETVILHFAVLLQQQLHVTVFSTWKVQLKTFRELI